MFEKIKRIFAIIIPLIIVGCLFYRIGFYLGMNFFIVPYLSLEDVVLSPINGHQIIGYIVLLIFIATVGLVAYGSKPEEVFHPFLLKLHEKTVFGNIRITGVFLILIFLVALVLFIFIETVRIAFMLYGISFLIVVGTVLGVKFLIKENKSDKNPDSQEKNEKDASTPSDELSEPKRWGLLLFQYVFLFIGIPLVTGNSVAKKYDGERVKIFFTDSTVINSIDSANLLLIGQSASFVFIRNKRTKLVTAYNVDEIRSITQYPKNYKMDAVKPVNIPNKINVTSRKTVTLDNNDTSSKLEDTIKSQPKVNVK